MLKNYSGEIYGNIQVLEMTPKRKKGQVVYKCKCNKCGREFENSIVDYRKRVKKGIKTVTCGCYDRHYDNFFYKNGLSKTRQRFIYNNMKARCYNKKDKRYKDYGGRGIKICDEWLNDFIDFYNWAMDNGYNDDLTIDRINNDGNYEPNNCRWITLKEQINNRRNTVFIEYNGTKKPLTEWAREYNIPINTLRKRLSTGWDIETALNKKVKKFFKGEHSEKFLKYNNLKEINYE